MCVCGICVYVCLCECVREIVCVCVCRTCFCCCFGNLPLLQVFVGMTRSSLPQQAHNPSTSLRLSAGIVIHFQIMC